MRIYHRDQFCPSAVFLREHGPLFRFDQQVASAAPDGRAVTYLGEELLTGLQESLGREPLAEVCPMWHAAFVHPSTGPVVLQDFVAASPTGIGAPDDLGDGPYPYAFTQLWAHAIYEDRPADPDVGGIRYWSRRHRGNHDERRGVNRAVWETAAPLAVLERNARSQELSLRSPKLWLDVVAGLRDSGIVVTPIERTACWRCQERGL